MKLLTVIVALTAPALLVGGGVNDATPAASPISVQQATTKLDPANSKETILLVSLDDGSVIMQTISTSADICFKQSTTSSTTCLTRGEPVVDPSTNAIIGFEMIEDQIDLVAK